jgi:GT2 family glycosyltransferase/2-polyprenyl-3-methyl-5-hydroxy-6-metoxy-1,4-benzoquinol methylase
MTENPTHVYWRQIADDERSSLSVLSACVPPQSRVLDLGIGSGALGQSLRELDCTLDGVTINPQERSVAAQWYRRIDLLDLDQDGWDDGFDDGAYDVIVCADVLEHLKRPELVLRACRRLLRPQGRLLVSIPNVAYAGLIANLMQGNFEYGNEGLMDRTHLRFFTRASFQQLLAAQGWSVLRVEAIDQPLHETEYTLAFDELPPAVARHLLAQPDASAYQLIFVAAADAPHAQTPITHDVRRVSAATFVSQLFVGSENGFAADRKLIGHGTIGQERQTLAFRIPESFGGWTGLRFDPADRPGYFWLYSITLRDCAAVPIWRWTASVDGAAELAACARHQLDIGQFDPARERLPLLLLGDDPHVTLPIGADIGDRCGAGCTLEVECGWPMSADYLAAAHRFNALEATVEAQAGRIVQLERELASAQGTAPPAADGAASGRAEAGAADRHPVRSIWQRLAAAFAAKVGPPHGSRFDPTVEIVVPIYGNLPLVQRCIRSVQGSACASPSHLTLIDDCSPDPAVRAWLREFALANPDVTVIENARNLGFVQTVNLGMRLAGRRDVVLLNSDTEVANDWLDRLRAAALSDPTAGTATPFSNNATICSYPDYCVDNPLPAGQDTASLDRLVASANRGRAIEIPTAVGFCMYIRRACLDQVGEFDADSFGQGYGEENDFCLRASALGWRHLHALDVFVFHQGGASFQETRHALQARALETIRRLHPGYEDLIRDFVQRDPARPFRAALERARAGPASAAARAARTAGAAPASARSCCGSGPGPRGSARSDGRIPGPVAAPAPGSRRTPSLPAAPPRHGRHRPAAPAAATRCGPPRAHGTSR